VIRSTTLKADLCAAFIFSLSCQTAIAGMVSISPLRIDFDPSVKTSVIQLTNTGESDMSMQVDTRQWMQSDIGEDAYESTADVLAVPPIFTLAPGETQLIRVGLLTPPSPDRESTYRLFFTELPSPGSETERKGQLLMRLSISLPIFSAPVTAAPAELELMDITTVDDKLRATFKNSGRTHLRLAEIAALDAGGNDTYRMESPVYMLAGSSREFMFDISDEQQISRLQAVMNTVGTREYEVSSP
jgi:fimbrial chaperone protein